MFRPFTAAFFIVSGAMFAAGFQGLGDLPGGHYFSESTSLSADGSTVVGSGSSQNGQEAFRWTPQEGIQPLGDLPGGAFQSWASDVSADGTVVTGSGTMGDLPNQMRRAFRWTSTGGMVALDTSVTVNSQTYLYSAIAKGLSNDGSVIVGKANYLGVTVDGPVMGDRACYWADNQMHLLTPPGYDYFSGAQAEAVSADGSVILIQTNYRNGYLWSESGGFSVLPSEVLRAYQLSGDGMVVGGFDHDYSSYIWSQGKGTTVLGIPDGWDHNLIGCMNFDGSVVGGALRTEAYFTSFDPQDISAYLWDEINGVRLVEDILSGCGVNLDGWSLGGVSDISDDGMTLCGWGVNPEGFEEAWIATIPEPTSLSLLLGGGLVLWRRGRRRIR